MKKFIAWAYLLPMGIYWCMLVAHHFEPSVEFSDVDRVAFAAFKQVVMTWAGLHFWGWYQWKD